MRASRPRAACALIAACAALSLSPLAAQVPEAAKPLPAPASNAGGGVPLSPLQRAILEAALAYGLEPALMLALAERESGFDPSARSRLWASRGRIGLGLYQFIPQTGRLYGLMSDEDRLDPGKSIDAAMRFMADIQRIVHNARDVKDLVAAWNYGPERMVRAIEAGLPPDAVTERGHVPLVMRYLMRWRARLRGLGAREEPAQVQDEGDAPVGQDAGTVHTLEVVGELSQGLDDGLVAPEDLVHDEGEAP
jgi:soluble lytic murein transglycosylase-like protein